MRMVCARDSALDALLTTRRFLPQQVRKWRDRPMNQDHLRKQRATDEVSLLRTRLGRAAVVEPYAYS